MYGISQDPDTKNYIMILQNKYCEKCGKYVYYKWCKSCHINYLKNNFTNWTSGNKKIDNFIQKMQLKISEYNDIILEWIPYIQFINIEEIGRDYNNFIIYLAIWNNGPLYYNIDKEKLIKKSEQVVLIALNYFDDIDKFLNKV
jgi:hypothetical protein